MIKKLYRGILLGIAGCLSVAGIAAYAYLTDSDVAVNKLEPSVNTTSISEEFPPPDPIPEHDEADIEKRVEIENVKGVPCYVRALVRFSTSDFGTCSIVGMSDKWVEGDDGYYYYTMMLSEGDYTEPLMTSVHVDGHSAAEVKAELDTLDIIVTEESIQAKNPETQEYYSWQEAWEEVSTKGGGR